MEELTQWDDLPQWMKDWLDDSNDEDLFINKEEDK